MVVFSIMLGKKDWECYIALLRHDGFRQTEQTFEQNFWTKSRGKWREIGRDDK